MVKTNASYAKKQKHWINNQEKIPVRNNRHHSDSSVENRYLLSIYLKTNGKDCNDDGTNYEIINNGYT